MSPRESLVTRIRGEYLEMPGLRLTFPQACRLWQVQPADCRAALQALLDEKFLVHTPEGAFVAATTTARRRPQLAKAAIPVDRLRRPA